MSDLFHKEVPRAFIDRVFDTMERADWHVFQVLTKRSSLLSRYLKTRYGDESRACSYLVRRFNRGRAGKVSDLLIFARLRQRPNFFL